MQQPNCHPCSNTNVKRITRYKPNIIHAIKHISFFCLKESQPTFFFMNSQKLPLSIIFFFLLKRASLFFSHQSQPSLFLLDPLGPPFCTR